MAERRRARSRLVAAFLLLAALAACGGDDGPAPVAWDRTRCARCGMLLSEPSFAAQLRGADGEWHFFDDPGCLLVTLDELEAHGKAPARIWFHDRSADRWIPGDAVAFSDGATTPMGYGLAASPRGTAGATIGLAQARALALERERARRPGAAPR